MKLHTWHCELPHSDCVYISMQISSQQRKVRSFGLPYQETKPDPHLHIVDDSQCWLTSLGRKKKKINEILVSVLLNLQHGAFSFTTKLTNSSPPRYLLQIWISAQKWPACSHFQGKMLIFWLRALHQGYQTVRSLNFRTRENWWCCFFFPKAYFNAYAAQSSFALFRSSWWVPN